MSDPLSVMAVIGSLHQSSVTKVAVNHVAEGLRKQGAEVDVLDLSAEPLPLVNTDTTFTKKASQPMINSAPSPANAMLGAYLTR